jgi:hypothetical protein
MPSRYRARTEAAPSEWGKLLESQIPRCLPPPARATIWRTRHLDPFAIDPEVEQSRTMAYLIQGTYRAQGTCNETVPSLARRRN